MHAVRHDDRDSAVVRKPQLMLWRNPAIVLQYIVRSVWLVWVFAGWPSLCPRTCAAAIPAASLCFLAMASRYRCSLPSLKRTKLMTALSWRRSLGVIPKH